MDDDIITTINKLTKALGQAQGQNIAQSYILMEIVRDLARTQPDPQKYIAGLFERVSGRADQGPVEKEAHPVQAEFRWTVETFFKHAGQSLGD
ncbi:hypothetical protein [Pararhizobium gei]|uniref:hypothetical protein n=1 Tax=Pararhizobium gei TaxID=1395951 RepID=UPI0023DC1D62|nr:hypothetical protein [Rhizobium gei]